MSDIIPSELPKPPKVPVSIEEEVVLEEEAIAAMRREGCIDLGEHTIHDLREVGIHVHSQGTIRVSRGRAIITQQRLDSTMKILHHELVSLSEDKSAKGRLRSMLAIAQTIGYLSARQTSSIALLVLMEGGKRNIDATGMADDIAQSFMQGQEVKPSQGNTMVLAREVHMHPSPNPR